MTRARRLRLAGALCALGVLGTQAAWSAPTTAILGPRRLRADLTHVKNETVTIPTHLPVPAGSSNIGPGSMLIITIPGAGTFGCTANFIWQATVGGQIHKYLGAAGHCFLPEDKAATHGPGSDYIASGVTTSVCVAACNFGGQTGAILTGTLVQLGSVAYARQIANDVQVGNDFGIVEIPSIRWSSIRTTMPVWGGPSGTFAGSFLGQILCHYGNGVVVGETLATKARAGVGTISFSGETWSGALASAFGDSGSAVNICTTAPDGVHGAGALGILTHLTTLPPGTSGTRMARAITLASQAGLSISLVA